VEDPEAEFRKWLEEKEAILRTDRGVGKSNGDVEK
jgi:hypothetical protein